MTSPADDEVLRLELELYRAAAADPSVKAAINAWAGVGQSPADDEEQMNIPATNAFVAVGATRFGDAAIQTAESLAHAKLAGSREDALREHLRLAVDHISALNGVIEDLVHLGCTVAVCGTSYDDAAARAALGMAEAT